MYNKYFTMKKSLLKEAIKSEIISTLSKGSLNENAPGFANRKMGDPLPTLESVKTAYEAKNNIKEGVDIDQMKIAIDEIASYLDDINKEEEVMSNVLGRHNSDPFLNMGEVYAYLDGLLQKYDSIKEKINERMVYDIELEDVVYTPEGDEVKVVDIRDIGGSNEQAYTVEKTDGTRFELGDKSLELTGDKLKRDSEGIEGVSKYYSTKNEIREEEMSDDEMDKKASKGAKKEPIGKEAEKLAQVQKFMRQMQDKGIVGKDKKILNTSKYKEEFAKFKAGLKK